MLSFHCQNQKIRTWDIRLNFRICDMINYTVLKLKIYLQMKIK